MDIIQLMQFINLVIISLLNVETAISSKNKLHSTRHKNQNRSLIKR